MAGRITMHAWPRRNTSVISCWAGPPAPKQPEKEERQRMTLQELEELVRSSEAEKQSRASLTGRSR